MLSMSNEELIQTRRKMNQAQQNIPADRKAYAEQMGSNVNPIDYVKEAGSQFANSMLDLGEFAIQNERKFSPQGLLFNTKYDNDLHNNISNIKEDISHGVMGDNYTEGTSGTNIAGEMLPYVATMNPASFVTESIGKIPTLLEKSLLERTFTKKASKLVENSNNFNDAGSLLFKKTVDNSVANTAKQEAKKIMTERASAPKSLLENMGRGMVRSGSNFALADTMLNRTTDENGNIDPSKVANSFMTGVALQPLDVVLSGIGKLPSKAIKQIKKAKVDKELNKDYGNFSIDKSAVDVALRNHPKQETDNSVIFFDNNNKPILTLQKIGDRYIANRNELDKLGISKDLQYKDVSSALNDAERQTLKDRGVYHMTEDYNYDSGDYEQPYNAGSENADGYQIEDYNTPKWGEQGYDKSNNINHIDATNMTNRSRIRNEFNKLTTNPKIEPEDDISEMYNIDGMRNNKSTVIKAIGDKMFESFKKIDDTNMNLKAKDKAKIETIERAREHLNKIDIADSTEDIVRNIRNKSFYDEPKPYEPTRTTPDRFDDGQLSPSVDVPYKDISGSYSKLKNSFSKIDELFKNANTNKELQTVLDELSSLEKDTLEPFKDKDTGSKVNRVELTAKEIEHNKAEHLKLEVEKKLKEKELEETNDKSKIDKLKREINNINKKQSELKNPKISIKNLKQNKKQSEPEQIKVNKFKSKKDEPIKYIKAKIKKHISSVKKKIYEAKSEGIQKILNTADIHKTVTEVKKLFNAIKSFKYLTKDHIKELKDEFKIDGKLTIDKLEKALSDLHEELKADIKAKEDTTKNSDNDFENAKDTKELKELKNAKNDIDRYIENKTKSTDKFDEVNLQKRIDEYKKKITDLNNDKPIEYEDKISDYNDKIQETEELINKSRKVTEPEEAIKPKPVGSNRTPEATKPATTFKAKGDDDFSNLKVNKEGNDFTFDANNNTITLGKNNRTTGSLLSGLHEFSHYFIEKLSINNFDGNVNALFDYLSKTIFNNKNVEIKDVETKYGKTAKRIYYTDKKGTTVLSETATKQLIDETANNISHEALAIFFSKFTLKDLLSKNNSEFFNKLGIDDIGSSEIDHYFTDSDMKVLKKLLGKVPESKTILRNLSSVLEDGNSDLRQWFNTSKREALTTTKEISNFRRRLNTKDIIKEANTYIDSLDNSSLSQVFFGTRKVSAMLKYFGELEAFGNQRDKELAILKSKISSMTKEDFGTNGEKLLGKFMYLGLHKLKGIDGIKTFEDVLNKIEDKSLYDHNELLLNMKSYVKLATDKALKNGMSELDVANIQKKIYKRLFTQLGRTKGKFIKGYKNKKGKFIKGKYEYPKTYSYGGDILNELKQIADDEAGSIYSRVNKTQQMKKGYVSSKAVGSKTTMQLFNTFMNTLEKDFDIDLSEYRGIDNKVIKQMDIAVSAYRIGKLVNKSGRKSEDLSEDMSKLFSHKNINRYVELINKQESDMKNNFLYNKQFGSNIKNNLYRDEYTLQHFINDKKPKNGYFITKTKTGSVYAVRKNYTTLGKQGSLLAVDNVKDGAKGISTYDVYGKFFTKHVNGKDIPHVKIGKNTYRTSELKNIYKIDKNKITFKLSDKAKTQHDQLFDSDFSTQIQRNEYLLQNKLVGNSMKYNVISRFQKEGIMHSTFSYNKLSSAEKDMYMKMKVDNNTYYVLKRYAHNFVGTNGVLIKGDMAANMVRAVTGAIDIAKTVLINFNPHVYLNNTVANVGTYMLHSPKANLIRLNNVRKRYDLVVKKSNDILGLKASAKIEPNETIKNNLLTKAKKLEDEIKDDAIYKSIQSGIQTSLRTEYATLETLPENKLISLLKQNKHMSTNKYVINGIREYLARPETKMADKLGTVFDKTEIIPKVALLEDLLESGMKESEAITYVKMSFPDYTLNLNNTVAVAGEFIPYMKYFASVPRMLSMAIAKHPYRLGSVKAVGLALVGLSYSGSTGANGNLSSQDQWYKDNGFLKIPFTNSHWYEESMSNYNLTPPNALDPGTIISNILFPMQRI